MPRVGAGALRRLGSELLVAAGAPVAEADLVADHLVESDLLGHDSHGVVRFPQYVDMVRQGVVRPGAPLELVSDLPCAARARGGWGFGPVTATAATHLAVGKARQHGLGAVAVSQCNHVARLGRFAALAARQGVAALIAANGHGGDLAVAPFGGRARRLPTNPLCVGLPSGGDWPLVLDMSTGMTSGGALRLYRSRGQAVPDGQVIDAQGEPTRDPASYYGPPPGAILPLGYPHSGHKGYGLAVVVDVLAGALSGAGCSAEAAAVSGNGLFVVAIDIEAFVPLDRFVDEARRLTEWIKSSPPAAGCDEVLLPGERAHRAYQERQVRGLAVDDETWQRIGQCAAELGVSLPAVDEG